jgi:hypothetical protein
LCEFEEIEISAQGKAVEVTVTRKEENSKNFVWFSSKNSASGQSKICPLTLAKSIPVFDPERL